MSDNAVVTKAMDIQVIMSTGGFAVDVQFESGTPVGTAWNHLLGVLRAVMRAWDAKPIFDGAPPMETKYRPAVTGEHSFNITLICLGGYASDRIEGFIAELGRQLDAYGASVDPNAGLKVHVHRSDVQ